MFCSVPFYFALKAACIRYANFIFVETYEVYRQFLKLPIISDKITVVNISLFPLLSWSLEVSNLS